MVALRHRLATWLDASPLYKLYQEPLNRPFITAANLDYKTYAQQYRKILSKNDLYIYHQGETIVGSYRLTRKAYPLHHILTLSRFVIATQHQGHGHGQRMLEEAILQVKPFLRIELLVETDNLKAIALYQKCGFQIEGRLKKFFYRPATDEYVDEYLMALVS